MQGSSSESRGITLRILLGAFALFAIIQFGVDALAKSIDFTSSAIIGSLVMIAVALLLGRALFGDRPALALRSLGFVSSTGRAVAVATIIALLMLAFFPVFSHVSGERITLKADFLWVLCGAIALNGVAEEALFRGWVFGQLRSKAGFTFGRAGFLSMLVFAAVHGLMFLQNPPVVAGAALFLAVAISFPMAFLFERGGNSIVGPVILHVAAHFIRLFDIPESVLIPATLAWVGLQIAGAFAVFAFRGLLRPS